MISVKKKVRNLVDNQVVIQGNDKVLDQVWEQVWEEVRWKVVIQVGHKVESQIWKDLK